VLSGKPVVAIAVNHEGLRLSELPWVCGTIERTVGLPVVDVLVNGPAKIVKALTLLVDRPRGQKAQVFHEG
jgi:hypothetical protein